MNRRSKSEQKAYLDGCEMIAKIIERYLSGEGKRLLRCVLTVVSVAVAESEEDDADNRF